MQDIRTAVQHSCTSELFNSDVPRFPSRPRRRSDPQRARDCCSRARCTIPGIGFVTLTRVQVTPDLQQARVFYTALGDEKARSERRARSSARSPFLRRQIGVAAAAEARRPSSSSSTTSRSPARTASSSS